MLYELPRVSTRGGAMMLTTVSLKPTRTMVPVVQRVPMATTSSGRRIERTERKDRNSTTRITRKLKPRNLGTSCNSASRVVCMMIGAPVRYTWYWALSGRTASSTAAIRPLYSVASFTGNTRHSCRPSRESSRLRARGFSLSRRRKRSSSSGVRGAQPPGPVGATRSAPPWLSKTIMLKGWMAPVTSGWAWMRRMACSSRPIFSRLKGSSASTATSSSPESLERPYFSVSAMILRVLGRRLRTSESISRPRTAQPMSAVIAAVTRSTATLLRMQKPTTRCTN